MSNPQYMWSCETACHNPLCDSYALLLDFPEMPVTPDNLYLYRDMNRKPHQCPWFLYAANLVADCLLSTVSFHESTVSTQTSFQRHFWAFMNAVCLTYHLDTATVLLDAIRAARAVLGGSCALYVFCPTSAWPENLDFFLPNQTGFANPLSDFLHLHGYCLLLQAPYVETAYYGDIVHHIELYAHQVSKRLIHLVYAEGPSPLGPLLDSHSTLIMNYISGNQAVCLYPATTLLKIGIRLQTHDGAMKVFAKYRQ